MPPQKRKRVEPQPGQIPPERLRWEEMLEKQLRDRVIKIESLEVRLAEALTAVTEKEAQLSDAAATFKTVFALKNAKLARQERELAELRAAKEEVVKQSAKKNTTSDSLVLRDLVQQVSKLGDKKRVVSDAVESKTGCWTFDVQLLDGCIKVRCNVSPLRGSNRSVWHAFVSFRLLSHADGSVLYEKRFDTLLCFTMVENSWGNSTFIRMKDLLNQKNGFVSEDSIIVEVAIKEVNVARRKE